MQYDRITPVTVAVRSPRGLVDIVAADNTAVDVVVAPMDGSEAAATAARETRVDLDGDTLTIHAPNSTGWQWRRSPRLAITVRVPTGSSIAVKVASADLRAAGRFGTAQVESASGDLAVEDVAGDAHLESASGDIAVGRVGGTLHAKSASGDLDIGDVTGDVITSSASGDIAVRSGGGSVAAQTASGDVEIGAVHRGAARLRSASGDIEVGVVAGTGVWLDVSTLSGDTVNDLAMTGGESNPPTGAALDLHIRTASGDIHIRRAAGDLSTAA